jgi:hypothetical protein
MNNYDIDKDKNLDEQIKPIVELLRKYGFNTYESCQGGEGHAFPQPTIRFEGDEFDLIRAYELCEHFGYRPSEVSRVYWKVPLSYIDTHECNLEKEIWDKPFNQITFYSC